jgi:catechol 2,3-dioxygenase-like lactoylglutathione lyase family enzyme
MATIDHVTIRVADLAASRDLYQQVFDLLEFSGERRDGAEFVEWWDFSIAQDDADHPATRNAHVALAASSREQVHRWWRELVTAGRRDDGAPGPRPIYSPGYYGAFVRDPDDNSVEAVVHETTTREPGLVDHLWIRVPELEPAKRFYAAVAAAVGLRVHDRGERLQLGADGASLAVLAGRPTESLHLAFGVGDRETVERFHRAALAGGGVDNGGPGERPQYHAGYWGAYVLDPGGNNIEAVFHDRG